MADEFKIWVCHEMDDILLGTGEAVVHTEDFMSVFQESFAEMGAEKTSSAGD